MRLSKEIAPHEHEVTLIFPPEFRYDQQLVGIAVNSEYPDSFQFLFGQETTQKEQKSIVVFSVKLFTGPSKQSYDTWRVIQSSADDSALAQSSSQWAKRYIPFGTVIRKVRLMYSAKDTKLVGVSLADSRDKTLLAVGPVLLENYLASAEFEVCDIILQLGERIVGVMSE